MKPLRKLVASLVFLAIAVVVVMFAVSNRGDVEVSLWPLPFAVDMRLSVAVLGALAVGIVIGGAIAWTSGASRRLRRQPGTPKAAASVARPAPSASDRPVPAESNRLPVAADRD